VGASNSYPTALITSHSNGDVVPDDEVYVMGNVTDPDDDSESLRTTWLIDGVEACPSEAPDESGQSRCLIRLSSGETEIALQVRDPLNALGQDKVTISVMDTAPPDVQIDSPRTGDRFYTDRKVALMGTVSDAEDIATDLDITWTSDLDGRLDIDTNVTSDGSVSAHASLTVGEHALTLEAEDSHGKTGSDAVVISVGPPNTSPSCTIISPEEGAIIDPDADTTFTGEGHDDDQDAHTLLAGWSSDSDGELGSAAPTTAGDVMLIVSGLSGGTHIITLTVTDELEEVCTDSVVVQVGTPPTIEITAPADGEVLEADLTHLLTAEVSDGEDPSTALSVQWRSSADGVVGSGLGDSAGLATAITTLSLGEHTLTATVSDTHGQATADTITVTIDDTPVVSAVTITPDPATARDALSCTWVFSDATGADASTVQWAIDGIPAGTGPTLSTGHVHGDVVTCTVTPFDGALTGDPVSDTLVVSNSPPSILAVVISPATPTAADTLNCVYAGFSDADGEADVSTLAWTRGGISLGTTPTLSGTFERGDELTCTVTPHDGTDAGLPLSQTVTIENTPPEVLSVAISPTTATTNDTLTALVTTSDAEGDPVTLAYAWTVDGVTVAETSSSLSGITHFDKHQVVQVTVTPNDGFTDGPPATSGSVTIDNSAPSAPSLIFIPEAPVEGEDDVWCAIDTAAADPDGDTVALSFTWELDGTAWSGGTMSTDEPGDTIALTETMDGQIWTCTVSTHDGETSGAEVSAEVTIDNAQTRVFVTESATSSDMGGVAGGDAHCQASADEAGLGGTWSAYLSGGGASAITRIAEGPYYRMDGALIANDKADLTDGSIAVPIQLTQYGTYMSTWVCTGATETGGSTGYDCVGWTRGCGVCDGDHWYVESGNSGRTSDDWSTAGWSFCGSCYLYCFED
jgi:hypothetical protein